MSTNYYFKPSKSPFDQFDDLHIGKVAGGWSFMLQGYDCTIKAQSFFTEVPGTTLSVKVEVPEISLKLRSWSDWKKFLEKTPGTVLDEYGHSLTLAELTELVEQTFSPKGNWNGRPLRSHYKEYRRGSESGTDSEDADGYSVCLRAFS